MAPAGISSHSLPGQPARRPLLRRALLLSLLSIVINVSVGVIAVVAGFSSGSLSLLGFGFDAAIDGAASVALVWRFSIEAQQPHRAETVERAAEAVVGAVLLVLAAYLGLSAIGALASGAHPEPSMVALGILILSVVALPPLAIAKYRTARALRSGALRADSILTGVAALLALIGLAGQALTAMLGLTWADAAGALVVAIILVREGWYAIRVSREA